jgi:hypothetical protein
MAIQPNMDELGNLIRHWAHYDTMLTTLNTQIRNVRALKGNYETQVLERLREYKAENAIIQIAGGKISVVEDKHTQPLTFKNMETMLHSYFSQKAGRPDETAEILRFIRTQRQTEISKGLKRYMTPGGT